MVLVSNLGRDAELLAWRTWLGWEFWLPLKPLQHLFFCFFIGVYWTWLGWEFWLLLKPLQHHKIIKNPPCKTLLPSFLSDFLKNSQDCHDHYRGIMSLSSINYIIAICSSMFSTTTTSCNANNNARASRKFKYSMFNKKNFITTIITFECSEIHCQR